MTKMHYERLKYPKNLEMTKSHPKPTPKTFKITKIQLKSEK